MRVVKRVRKFGLWLGVSALAVMTLAGVGLACAGPHAGHPICVWAQDAGVTLPAVYYDYLDFEAGRPEWGSGGPSISESLHYSNELAGESQDSLVHFDE